ncbi:hypothetical protein [Dendronalium sp. ChiSLP03b]|uniref:hypothetical protein n=1 Tax=Dendronalium sp. ChiSLP03b TaxID=3075381 RepID=UPI00391D79E0
MSQSSAVLGFHATPHPVGSPSGSGVRNRREPPRLRPPHRKAFTSRETMRDSSPDARSPRVHATWEKNGASLR